MVGCVGLAVADTSLIAASTLVVALRIGLMTLPIAETASYGDWTPSYGDWTQNVMPTVPTWMALRLGCHVNRVYRCLVECTISTTGIMNRLIRTNCCNSEGYNPSHLANPSNSMCSCSGAEFPAVS